MFKGNKPIRYVFLAVLLAGLMSGSAFFLKRLAKPNGMNILLISIDALRPDHLGCYGYKRDTSPNIDILAERGARFAQAITQGGWTVDAVPSLLTGAYPSTHRIATGVDPRNPFIKTLAQELSERGYYCVLWSNHMLLKPLDIHDGFHRVYVRDADRDGKYQPLMDDHTLTSQMIDRLKKRPKGRPFFWYIHYWGAHSPYRPPVPYKDMYLHDRFRGKPRSVPVSGVDEEDMRYNGYKKIPYVVAEDKISDPGYYISQYDGAISFVDAQIGRLTEALKECGLYGNTLIILTADHGEMLGEHGYYFQHHNHPYDEVLRVPLIMNGPMIPEGRVIDHQAQLIDIMPTVLSLLRIKINPGVEGRSLLPLMSGADDGRGYAFNELFLDEELRCVSVRSPEWKLIYTLATGTHELYDLKNDPGEETNLAGSNNEELGLLKTELKEWMERGVADAHNIKMPLDPEVKKRLKSLGYVQ